MKNKHFNNQNKKLCTYDNKICYDEKSANIILVMNQVSADSKRRECRKYYCEKCRHWHLTSQK